MGVDGEAEGTAQERPLFLSVGAREFRPFQCNAQLIVEEE
jgi:hypothetical protein